MAEWLSAGLISHKWIEAKDIKHIKTLIGLIGGCRMQMALSIPRPGNDTGESMSTHVPSGQIVKQTWLTFPSAKPPKFKAGTPGIGKTAHPICWVL